MDLRKKILLVRDQIVNFQYHFQDNSETWWLTSINDLKVAECPKIICNVLKVCLHNITVLQIWKLFKRLYIAVRVKILRYTHWAMSKKRYKNYQNRILSILKIFLFKLIDLKLTAMFNCIFINVLIIYKCVQFISTYIIIFLKYKPWIKYSWYWIFSIYKYWIVCTFFLVLRQFYMGISFFVGYSDLILRGSPTIFVQKSKNYKDGSTTNSSNNSTDSVCLGNKMS